MKNLTRKVTLLVAIMAVLVASVSAGEWMDALKGAASSAAQTVKEKGPGWAATAKDKASAAAEVVKEKAPEVWENTKEAVSNAQEQFSTWNAGQRDQFNDWFNTMTNGAGSASSRNTSEDTQPEIGISESTLGTYDVGGVYYYDPEDRADANAEDPQQATGDGGASKNDVKAVGLIDFVKKFVSTTMLTTIKLAGG